MEEPEMEGEEITTRPIGVQNVPIDELRANPHNPRVLFDREPLDILKASIKRVGILVPLTVYRDSKRQKYTILDGQRRWLCAQELAFPAVPVNEVAEPSLAQNIVTMFQIHKLREDWELMPTALKLELLIKELDERREKQLAALTGLDVAVVARCKKLLTYSKKYRSMMLRANPGERVKADFFIELYPVIVDQALKKFVWYKRSVIVDSMLRKYTKGKSGFKSVTDFRKIKQIITTARKANNISSFEDRFKKFLDDDEMDFRELETTTESVHKKSEAIYKSVANLTSEVKEIDPDLFYGENELWEALEKLVEEIKKKLDKVDYR